ncbi:hypothetical protein LshimejAT787_0408970 [Lyophyllum shimeji]|uniref:Homeobox domain-containing protein n=1 Tax=Lyophyllum shimeji TaxID=47721 RepID=A0A9P3PM56_LYOSH|nr:hypothetical protein LshimejAT787_0408970 [Lyophyllum shimeji]
MSAGPSSLNPAPQKRRRINAEGIAVMEAYLNETHNYSPSPAERNVLLEKIQAIPGCEEYDRVSIAGWFRRRRQALSGESKRKTSQAFAQNTTYPSLTQTAIQHLTTLSQAQPSPPLSVIQTWAELLHAGVEDIKAWLCDQQQQLDVTRHRSPAFHLPTPVSTSPEPPSEYQWGVASSKIDPLHSPVIPAFQPPAFRSTSAQPAECNILSPSKLLDAIAEASRTFRQPTSLPESKEDFEKMFEPYAIRIRSIQDHLDSLH